MKKTAIDSLIFDLDGTLWSALDACVMAWNATLQKTGTTHITVTAQMVTGFIGKTLDAICAEHFTHLPVEKLTEIGVVFVDEEMHHMKQYGGVLYPGTKEALTALKQNYRLFIVSNCQEGYIENFIHWHGMHGFFEDHECIGVIGKPKADNIGMIIQRNNLTSPVYIGDTAGDFAASRINNMPFVYAAYGFGKVEGAEYKINALAGLGDVLDNMG